MQPVNKDTVEEFWQLDLVEHCCRTANAESVDKFTVKLAGYLGAEKNSCLLGPSGRWALRKFLETVKKPGKPDVLICAFNCPVVAEAIIQSGHNVVVFDLDAAPGRFNNGQIEMLLGNNVRAIVISHFFGSPVDFRWLRNRCREHNILVVEDCAHTLGGKIGSQMAGRIGDASIFSFNYDKPLSLGWGGMLLVNTPKYLDILKETDSVGTDAGSEKAYLQIFLETMYRRRRNIRRDSGYLTKLLRLLKLNKLSVFEIPELSVGPLRAELGLWQLDRYDEVKKIRNANAKKIIGGARNYTCWMPEKGTESAWLKQKVLLNDQGMEKSIARRLQRSGIRLGNFNWSQLAGVGTSLDNSRRMAESGLDVPIHQNMTQKELETIIDSLNRGA